MHNASTNYGFLDDKTWHFSGTLPAAEEDARNASRTDETDRFKHAYPFLESQNYRIRHGVEDMVREDGDRDAAGNQRKKVSQPVCSEEKTNRLRNGCR